MDIFNVSNEEQCRMNFFLETFFYSYRIRSKERSSRLKHIHVISSRERKSSIYDSVLFSVLCKDIVFCPETKKKKKKNAMMILHIVPLGIIGLIRFDSSLFRQGIRIFVYMRSIIVYEICTGQKME